MYLKKQSYRENVASIDCQCLVKLLPEDNSIFWVIWERCKDNIYQQCLWYMNNRQYDAEDLLSSVMLKAFEKMPANSEKIHNVESWLRQLAKNEFIDLYRRKKRHDVKSLDALKKDHHVDIESRVKSADLEFLDKEMKVVILHCIDRMRVKLKNVAISFFVNRDSYQAISERLNISVVNVRKRVQLARKILMEEIEKYRTDRYENSRLLDTHCDLSLQKEEVMTERKYEVAIPIKHQGKNVSWRIDCAGVSPLRIDQKIKALEKYVDSHQKSFKKKMILAECYLVKGMLDESMRLCEQCMVLKANSIQPYIHKIRINQLLERHQDNEELLKKALNLPCSEGDKTMLEMLLLECQGRIDEAIEKGVQSRGDNFSLEKELKLLSLLVKKNDRRDMYDQCLRIESYSPFNEQVFQILYESKKNFEGELSAHFYLKEFMKRRPTHISSRMAFVMKKMDDDVVLGVEGEKVLLMIEGLVRDVPHFPDVVCLKACFYLKQYKKNEALKVMNDHVSMNKECFRSWYCHARVLHLYNLFSTKK